MKVIDEKGRLFGRLNIIDFFVILFLFFLIGMFYFGYNVFSKKPANLAQKPREFKEFAINCKFIKLKPELLKLISIGDQEKYADGTTLAEIIWLGGPEPYRYMFDIGSATQLTKEDEVLKEMAAKIKVNAEIIDGNLYYKDKQIAINSPFEFATAKYAATVIPIKEEEKRKAEKVNLNIILKNLSEDTLKLISVGDRELDKNGEEIAEILKIGKVENNAYNINLGAGNTVLGEDTSKKQAFVNMKLKCEISKDGKLYFKGKEIQYDTLLEFDVGKYNAKGIIANLLINEKWVEAKIKFSGVIPELAKAINAGDIEKDPEGKIVARIKTIITNTPTEIQVVSAESNKVLVVNQPFQRDIVVSLNILCIEKENTLYFKNYPVKMGNMITFTTDLYSIQGIIIGLENI